MESDRLKEERVRLGKRIRQLRQQQELSLRALGLMSGVSYRYLYQIEHAECSPTVDTLVRLTSALDIALGDLF